MQKDNIVIWHFDKGPQHNQLCRFCLGFRACSRINQESFTSWFTFINSGIPKGDSVTRKIGQLRAHFGTTCICWKTAFWCIQNQFQSWYCFNILSLAVRKKLACFMPPFVVTTFMTFILLLIFLIDRVCWMFLLKCIPLLASDIHFKTDCCDKSNFWQTVAVSIIVICVVGHR